MLVLGSFLRTSTWPAVMKNMELPGAPSRTMTVAGAKSRRRMRLTTCWQSSLVSALKSLMRCKKCAASLVAAAAAPDWADAVLLRLGNPDSGLMLGLAIRSLRLDTLNFVLAGEGASIYQKGNSRRVGGEYLYI